MDEFVMRLIWYKRAERRLHESAVYSAQEFGKAFAESFMKDVLGQATLLCNHPRIGKVEPLLVSKHAHQYRSLVVHPYFKLIYYINEAKERIVITNFWDTRREPKQLSEETKAQELNETE